MEKLSRNVGLDSQCYTYLIDAMSITTTPTDSLAEQKIALFRTFLYGTGVFHLVPTVRKEFEKIRQEDRRSHHDDWTSLLAETTVINQIGVDARVKELMQFHASEGDATILAEAEDADLAVLLTFDSKFISRLSLHTQVSLLRPTEFWESLQVPKGANPITRPHPTNEIAAQTWWQWK